MVKQSNYSQHTQVYTNLIKCTLSMVKQSNYSQHTQVLHKPNKMHTQHGKAVKLFTTHSSSTQT